MSSFTRFFRLAPVCLLVCLASVPASGQQSGGTTPLAGDSPAPRQREESEAARAYRCGVDLLWGLGEKIDVQEGLQQLRQAAEKGHPLAQGVLATCWRFGRGAEKDVRQAGRSAEQVLPAVAALAAAGDAEALFVLARFSEDGLGKKKDDAEAVRWYRQAADRGLPAAMTNLGWMYDTGRGVAKDDNEAVRWYRQAADKGDPVAMNNLGWMYAKGRGVKKDDAEALRWYHKAADKEYTRAMTNLGKRYENGCGVAQDDAEAVRWYRQAAEKGYPRAMTYLGCMYVKGRGVEKDAKEAVRWFRKAADKDDACAMVNLGEMYENGEGVESDEKEAVRWYERAAKLGNKSARGALNRIRYARWIYLGFILLVVGGLLYHVAGCLRHTSRAGRRRWWAKARR